jgi:cupin fold WbuC family metalloprotein
MKLIDRKLLTWLSAQAAKNPRLRQNFNIHDSNDEACQRLLNAVEPGSYIRPHRHLTFAKPESFVGLRGRIALLIFDNSGEVLQIVPFGPQEDVAGADIPCDTWHTVVSLEAGSVFYEAKPGPFDPSHKSDMASWAPEEGSPEAPAYLQGLVDLVVARG